MTLGTAWEGNLECRCPGQGGEAAEVGVLGEVRGLPGSIAVQAECGSFGNGPRTCTEEAGTLLALEPWQVDPAHLFCLANSVFLPISILRLQV